MLLIKFEEVKYCTCVKRPSKHIKSPYVADIDLDGVEYLAHCPSLGLGGIIKPGSEMMITKSNLNSKTDFVIQAVKEDNTWVGNVPLHANRIVKLLLETNQIIPNIEYIKPEYKYGESRLDFYVKTKDDNEIFIEVKSVHIKKGKTAIFPVGYLKPKAITVSERANKHITELTHIAEAQGNAMIIFVIQRDDCFDFKPNEDSDKVFTHLFNEAVAKGVKVKEVYTSINDSGITLKNIKCN